MIFILYTLTRTLRSQHNVLQFLQKVWKSNSLKYTYWHNVPRRCPTSTNIPILNINSLMLSLLPLSFALTLASSTASWHSSIPITFLTLWKQRQQKKVKTCQYLHFHPQKIRTFLKSMFCLFADLEQTMTVQTQKFKMAQCLQHIIIHKS